MATVEPVFGQVKQGRGFRQFLLRGLAQVQGEWLLICTGYHRHCAGQHTTCGGLVKLFQFGGPLPAPHPPPRLHSPAGVLSTRI